MKFFVLAMTAILVSGLLARQAFSQAAAESVLTHSLGSGASSSMGKKLGNAIGQAAGQVGSKLGQQTYSSPAQQRVQVVKSKNSTTPTSSLTPSTANTTSGSFIASIQGGSSSPATSPCETAVRPAPAAPGKDNPVASSSVVKSADPPNCASADANAHPSVVNLPAAN